MNYTRENLPKSQVKFSYTVTGEPWKNAITKAYEKTKNNYEVEGFRKGKVPQKVIESKYGAGVFFEDALDAILPDAYSMALDKEKDVVPVARPDVQLVAITDTEVKFNIVVTVKPEIELGQYTGLELKKLDKKVTKEDIDAKIKESQEKAGSWEDVKGRAVKNGDTVDLNYSGTTDGEKFEGGTADNQSLEIGSGTFIPGFEEQLVGMNVGDEKDINVTFPKEYAEPLAGKEAVFSVKINAIKTKVLPELDDEFAKDVSEFDTLDEYKKDIEKQLQKALDEECDNEMTNSIIDKVIDNSKMEIPKAMVESQIDDMVQEFAQRLQYQGMKLEDYLKYTGMKLEDMRAQYDEIALKNIKIRLILDAIVSKEGFEATDEECDIKIKEMAEKSGKELDDFKKNITPEYMDYFRNMIVSDKMIDFLKKNNSFVG